VQGFSFSPLPTVLIEALALGVCVVSTDCKSGPREILQGGKLGSLVPPSDSAALSDAIMMTFINPRHNSDGAVTPFFSSIASQRYEALLEALRVQ
jgi:glycosyltransferase involved in cell wall biosynthesis